MLKLHFTCNLIKKKLQNLSLNYIILLFLIVLMLLALCLLNICFYYFIYLYLKATQQNSKMITMKDNKLKQILKKRGKRKKSTYIIYCKVAGRLKRNWKAYV